MGLCLPLSPCRVRGNRVAGVEAASSRMSLFSGRALGQLPPGGTDGQDRRANPLPVTPALPCRFSVDVRSAPSGAQRPGGSEASPTRGSASEASQGRASHSSSASRSSPRRFSSYLTRTAGAGANPWDLNFQERPVHQWGESCLLEGPPATKPLTLRGPQATSSVHCQETGRGFPPLPLRVGAWETGRAVLTARPGGASGRHHRVQPLQRSC